MLKKNLEEFLQLESMDSRLPSGSEDYLSREAQWNQFTSRFNTGHALTQQSESMLKLETAVCQI